MSSERPQSPFKNLGERLKAIREKLHESVAEVSGAVEIEETILLKIEQGQLRPSEDILMLLINHFGMRDEDASNLWSLAGYEQPRDTDAPGREHPEDLAAGRSTVLIMAVDPRVIYSDGVQVTVNRSGIVLNFNQGGGTPQAITTARVGMSREQARNVLHILQKALDHSEPRQLPSPENQDRPQNEK